MGQPAAKKMDSIVGVDMHLVPGATNPVPMPFNGLLVDKLSSDVFIEGMEAAVQGSEGTNNPPHVGTASPASNKGSVMMGSSTVMINGKPAARVGDTCLTCNDPADLPNGSIVGSSKVFIGG